MAQGDIGISAGDYAWAASRTNAEQIKDLEKRVAYLEQRVEYLADRLNDMRDGTYTATSPDTEED